MVLIIFWIPFKMKMEWLEFYLLPLHLVWGLTVKVLKMWFTLVSPKTLKLMCKDAGELAVMTNQAKYVPIVLWYDVGTC